MIYYFIGIDEKIPDCLRLYFQERLKKQLGIKSRFGIMIFSISDTILGLWFSSLTVGNSSKDLSIEG